MLVKLNEVAAKVSGDVDRFTTDLEYYLGGEHYESDRIAIYKKGIIKENLGVLGFKFHFPFVAGDTIFMSRNPHLKKAGMITYDGICSDTSYILRTKDKKVLAERYLPLILQNERFWRWFEENKSGSVNYLLNWKTLKEYEFELPSIEEQNRIADAAWAIEETIVAYEHLLETIDELVKARFIEMFGGIKEHILLEDCCTLHARVGWQALKKEEYMKQGEYMLITGTDFVEGKVDFSTCVYVSKERYDMDDKIQVKNGDILVTKDGTIGKVAIVEGLEMPATLNAGIFVIRPDGRFDVDYFSYLFKGPIFADFVESVKSGSTIKHLNQGKLLKYEIPDASQEQQTQFAEFYRQSEKAKASIQQSLNDAKALQKIIIETNYAAPMEED